MSAAAPIALGAELARKAIHLASALVPIAWGLGWVSDHALRLALTGALLLAGSVELARRYLAGFRHWFTTFLGPMLRRHEHGQLAGATWLALGMCVVAVLAPKPAALAALWAAAVGDAAAALVGRGMTRWRGPGPAMGKTWMGSAACVAATAPGVLWLADASWPMALGLGAVAAVAERPAGPGDDNLRVALATALAAVALGLR